MKKYKGVNNLKFKECDIKKYTLLKSEKEMPCMMCKENTKFIDYCCEGRLCSTECSKKFYDIVAKQE